MSDVRLTATNPEDSSVVPVACNASGELLLEAIPDQSFDGNLEGDLVVNTKAPEKGPGLIVSSQHSTPELGGWIRLADANTGVTRSQWGYNLSVNDVTFDLVGADCGLRIRSSDSNMTSAGDLIVIDADGFVEFEGTVSSSKWFESQRTDGTSTAFYAVLNGEERVNIRANGSAYFDGDVVAGSRGKQWTLVEQGGLCHMIEETRRSSVATADLVEPDEPPKYPKLRDVFHELDLIEQALEEVMTKLRLDPPAGWPVWDGSDNLSATD